MIHCIGGVGIIFIDLIINKFMKIYNSEIIFERF